MNELEESYENPNFGDELMVRGRKITPKDNEPLYTELLTMITLRNELWRAQLSTIRNFSELEDAYRCLQRLFIVRFIEWHESRKSDGAV